MNRLRKAFIAEHAVLATHAAWLLKMGSRFDQLSSHQKRSLQHLRLNAVPLVLVQLCALVYVAGLAETQSLDAIEYFAGDKAITLAFASAGYNAISYELKDDSICEDILSRAGFAYAITLILRLRPGGVVWFERPPWKSFNPGSPGDPPWYQ